MSVPAFVMNTLAPFTTQMPSRSLAVVRVAPASEPASGSVSPNAARRSPLARDGIHCCFCSSVPNRKIGIVPSEVCAASVIATDESMRASSSIAIAYASVSPPAPPSSSGNGIPIRPRSAISATSSYGNRASRSISSATGATRSTANPRTVSRKSSCSDERSRSTRGDGTRRIGLCARVAPPAGAAASGTTRWSPDGAQAGAHSFSNDVASVWPAESASSRFWDAAGYPARVGLSIVACIWCAEA